MQNANQDLRTGCLSMAARVVVIRLAAVGIVFVVGIFAIFIGFVVGGFTEAIWGVTAAAVTFFLIIFVGGNLFLAGAVLRRKMRLDRAFVPLGLQGSAYRLMFRRYLGSFAGRDTEAYFYRGPVLDVLVKTRVNTRAGFTLDYADTTAFASALGKAPVAQNLPGMEDVRVWSDDEAWATQAMMDPLVARDLKSLLSERAFFVRSVVKVMPGYAQLQLSGNKNVMSWGITPELARKWVGTLAAFAEHTETRVPRPSAELQLTQAEEFALKVKRKDTSKITIYFAIGLIAFFGLVTVVVAVIVAIIANLK